MNNEAPKDQAAAPRRDVWMISGCSSGFGRALAEALLQRGHKVVLTARDVGTIRDLASNYPERAIALPLDAVSKSSIDDAVSGAHKAFGHVDVLVNNAGYGYFAPVEEGDEQAVRAMFETNFYGAIKLTQAVLPRMRLRRNGVIVNISSAAGFVAHPGSGFYAATKFALEAISESLSKEIAPLGLRVLLVEPGPFRTSFFVNAQEPIQRMTDDYASTVGARRAAVSAALGKQPGDPVRAAEAIIAAVLSTEPPLRLVLGRQALANFRLKIESMTSEIAAWEATTINCDFPH